MGHHTDACELAQAVFISGVEARTLLQAAAWLNDLSLQSLYLSPDMDIFGAVCAKNGHEGPVHLMQIDTFTATANQAGLFDPILSCRDGSSCLTERCSSLLDVVPPGGSCDGCTVLSGAEWDTALMQLQQRITVGAAADLHTQRAVHTSSQQVATTMIRLCSLQRCYQLLIPLNQMLAAHGHNISQVAPVVKELQGTTQQQQQQQDAAGKGCSNWALGLQRGGLAASLRRAAQQAVRETLPHFPQQQYGVLLDLLANTLSKLQELSVNSLLSRALSRERNKQWLLDVHDPQATQSQLDTAELQRQPDQQQYQPQQVPFSAQQQPKLLVKQERQLTARLKRSAADIAAVHPSAKQRRVSNQDSPKGAQQQQASPLALAPPPTAAQSQQGLRATISTPSTQQQQQQMQPQLQSPFRTVVNPAVATPATPAVASSHPEILTAVTPSTPSAPQQQARQGLRPQVPLAKACSSDMSIDNGESVNVTAEVYSATLMDDDEAGGAAAERIVEEPRAASGAVAIPAVQSSCQPVQDSPGSPTPQVPATPTPKKPQGSGTGAICPAGSASRTAVNLMKRLDKDSCTEPTKQSHAAGSTGQKSSAGVGSKGSEKAAAAVLPSSAAGDRVLHGQLDFLAASPAAADVPKPSSGSTETQQQKQQERQLADKTNSAAAVAANRSASRSGATESLQAVSESAAGSKPSVGVTEAPMPAAAATATGLKAPAAATGLVPPAASKAGPKLVNAEAAATKLVQTATVREGSKPAEAAATTEPKLAAQVTAGVKPAKAAAATAGSQPADEAAKAGAVIARPTPAARANEGTKPAEAQATGLKPVTAAIGSQPAATAAAAGSQTVSTAAITPVGGSEPARLAAAVTGSEPANKAAAAASRLRPDQLVSAAAATRGAATPPAVAPAKRPAVKESVTASGAARPSPAAPAGRADPGSQAMTAGDTAGNHRHHRGLKGSSGTGSSSGAGRTAIPTPPPPRAAAAAGDETLATVSSTTESGKAMDVGRQYYDSDRKEAERITVAAALQLLEYLAVCDGESTSVSSLISACPDLPESIRVSPPAVAGYLMHRSNLFRQHHRGSKQDPYIGLHENFWDVLLVDPWVLRLTYQYRMALGQAARDSEASGSVGVDFGTAAVPPLLPKELLPIKQLFKPFYHFARRLLEHSDLLIVPHFTTNSIILKDQLDKYAEQYIPQLLCRNDVSGLLPCIADTLIGELQQRALPGRDLGVPRLSADDAVKLIQEQHELRRFAFNFQVPGFFTALMTDTVLSDTFWWASYTEPGSSDDASSHDGNDPHHVQYIELRWPAAQHRRLALKHCPAWKRVVSSGGDLNKCRNGWRCWFCHAP